MPTSTSPSECLETKWCGCKADEECKGHTMKVVIDGKVQPHLNALDVLKHALNIKMGRVQEREEIPN